MDQQGEIDVTPPQVTNNKSTDSLPTQSVPALDPATTAAISNSDNEWKNVLTQAAEAIVYLKYIRPRTFTTFGTGARNASGFVVSVEHSLILTNKHVIGDGPFIGKAVFKNSEEASCVPVWVDPVHDFGFLRFDKTSLKFMQLKELVLSPESLKIGMQVRIPGSDNGEKLAVLSGIVARADRPAPDYGKGKFCDFNTFYIQASANTSGGSSGSPVINIEGKVVALNAGSANKAASSYFLPLNRVKRALQFILRGEPVPRGTVQVEFTQKAFNDCRRLGMSEESEKEYRDKDPDVHGMLSVKLVVPQGTGDKKLVTGDLILSVNGVKLNHFHDLAEALDSNIGKTVSFELFRNKKVLTKDVPVQDLCAIDPKTFVEAGKAIINPMNYNLARQYNHPITQEGNGGPVILSSDGFAFKIASIPVYSIITAVNHKPTPNVDAFIEACKDLYEGQRIPVRYYLMSKKNVDVVRILQWESKFCQFRVANRNASFSWTFSDIPHCLDLYKQPTTVAKFLHIEANRNTITKFMSVAVSQMCLVRCYHLYGADGHNDRYTSGIGFVLDASVGLVLADRHAVPTNLSRVVCDFGFQVRAPAKLIYSHPLNNYVWIVFDTSATTGTSHQSVKMSPIPPRVGDRVHYLSMNTSNGTPRAQATKVRVGAKNTLCGAHPPSKSVSHFYFYDTSPPRFRSMNWDEAIVLDASPDNAGLIVDSDGLVQAFYLVSPEGKSRYAHAFTPSSHIKIITAKLVAGLQSWKANREEGAPFTTPRIELPKIRVIDAEFTTQMVATTRSHGLPEKWIDKLRKARRSYVKAQHKAVRETLKKIKEEKATKKKSRQNKEDVKSDDDEGDGQVQEANEDAADTQSIEDEAVTTDDVSDGMQGLSINDGLVEFSQVIEDSYEIIAVRRVKAQVKSSNSSTVDLPQCNYLRELDFVLACNGKPVFSMREHLMKVEDEDRSFDVANLTVFRDGKLHKLSVPTVLLSGGPYFQSVHWAGVHIQPPYQALYYHAKTVPNGVYVSLLNHGSPAERDGLAAGWFIIEVNGKPTPNLNAFLECVEGDDWRAKVPLVDPIEKGWNITELQLPMGTPNPSSKETFRLKLMSMEQTTKVITIDICEVSRIYWPTWAAFYDE